MHRKLSTEKTPSLSRRKLILGGLATAAGASGLGAAVSLASRYGLIPPDHGGLYGVGETLTYASHRLLMATGSTAREFSRRDISQAAPINGRTPVLATSFVRRRSGRCRTPLEAPVRPPNFIHHAGKVWSRGHGSGHVRICAKNSVRSVLLSAVLIRNCSGESHCDRASAAFEQS